mgnify:CR=1 FL=1
MAKVTKHGGTIYLGIFGAGTGILSQITNLFRSEYIENPEFRSLIDTLDREKILESLSYIYAELKNHDDSIIKKIPSEIISSVSGFSLVIQIGFGYFLDKNSPNPDRVPVISILFFI